MACSVDGLWALSPNLARWSWMVAPGSDLQQEDEHSVVEVIVRAQKLRNTTYVTTVCNMV